MADKQATIKKAQAAAAAAAKDSGKARGQKGEADEVARDGVAEHYQVVDSTSWVL